MTSNRQKWLRILTGIIFFSFLILFATYTIKITREDQTDVFSDSVVSNETISQNNSDNTASLPTNESPKTETNPAVLPANPNLDVPFASQAPFAVWDPLHEDACEEASLLMLKHFEDTTSFGGNQAVDDEITNLVAWEEQNGYGPSITLEDLSIIAKTKFNLTGSVKIATVSKIKTELAAGNPVIVGAAGKILPNPNFRNGGPNYHMLVIKGYTTTKFITNDPGTRNGADFVYTYNDLFNAIHNWDADNILNGAKEYLVFK
ncbi:MAG: C39 family peptidase [bacterium]|nr:C39 family peptidase [bacterium]